MDRGAWWATVHWAKKKLGTTDHMNDCLIMSTEIGASLVAKM